MNIYSQQIIQLIHVSTNSYCICSCKINKVNNHIKNEINKYDLYNKKHLNKNKKTNNYINIDILPILNTCYLVFMTGFPSISMTPVDSCVIIAFNLGIIYRRFVVIFIHRLIVSYFHRSIINRYRR